VHLAKQARRKHARLASNGDHAPDLGDEARLGEAAYLGLLRRILDDGEWRPDRTGTGTISIFGAQIRFDLRQGFPLITTKKVPFKSIIRELLWFLSGATNVRDGLTQHTAIWDAWADEDGDLGPIYGHQWRNWGGARALGPLNEAGWSVGGGADGHQTGGLDQIQEALRTLKRDPSSRRIIVSAWNTGDVPRMRLPPCHLLFQFYSSVDCDAAGRRYLDLQLYQRAADMALGVPFNIASYALLLSMFATECQLAPRYFVHTLGDAHVYVNHVDGIRRQLERTPLPPPRLVLSQKPVLAQTFEDVRLEDYQHHPPIKFEVSV
jgi:thymidylate synthase